MALAAGVFLLAVGGAAARGLDRGYTPPGRVTALDETAAGIATALAWSPRSCESVVLWQPPLFARRTFRAPGACPQTSTGRGISSVATDSSRVVWLSYVGGNTREYTLWTATPTRRTPRQLRFASADVDAPAPIVLGNGGESGIPYAVGRDVFVIGPSGARIRTWRAPARVTGLAEGATSVGVLVDTGHLFVVPLKSGGRITDLDYPRGIVRAFRIATVGAIVQTPTGIELRTASGASPLVKRPGARLAGFADGQLVYTIGNQIREFARSSRRDVPIRLGLAPLTTEFDRTEYHTQYDTADRVDFEYLAKLTEVCARLLLDAPPELDFAARARELRKVPHAKLQRALDDLANAKGRHRFTAVGRGLHGLDAIDAPRYPHEQTAADVALLEQALADLDNAAEPLARVGLNWLCSDLSPEAFKRERARRDRNAPRACWGMQGDADPGPDLWRELASLRGEPGARPPGPWLERSLRRHLQRSRRELERRLDRMAEAAAGRIFPLRRPRAADLPVETRA